MSGGGDISGVYSSSGGEEVAVSSQGAVISRSSTCTVSASLSVRAATTSAGVDASSTSLSLFTIRCSRVRHTIGQHGFRTVAYTRTDESWGNIEPGSESDTYDCLDVALALQCKL